ncbi:MAG: AAA family ATPase [Anaerolineales bacterium]|nr:AAA family ATPase [Anaerolineales bacterium]
MAIPNPLPTESLRRPCNPEQFQFTTTADLPDLDDIIGQERAVEAIRFGIGIQHDGFNLFALGQMERGSLRPYGSTSSKKRSNSQHRRLVLHLQL